MGGCSNRVSSEALLKDKWLALIGGQISCSYWGTNGLLLLRDKWLALIEGQMTCPYWGTNGLPLLRKAQIDSVESGVICWEAFIISDYIPCIFIMIWYFVLSNMVLPNPCQQTLFHPLKVDLRWSRLDQAVNNMGPDHCLSNNTPKLMASLKTGANKWCLFTQHVILHHPARYDLYILLGVDF